MTENSHEACRPKENTGASSVWIQEAGCIKTVLITGNLITGNVDPCGTTVRYSWFVQEPLFVLVEKTRLSCSACTVAILIIELP